jgi:hypothetical protein
MQFPLPANVQQVSSRSIRIGDRSVRTTYPIDHLAAVADRLILAVERDGDAWFYQSFAVDPEFDMQRGRLYGFTARVDVGTHITLPRNHNRGLVLSSGLEASLPGNVWSVVETPDGFVAVVDPFDVPIDNAFFIERDGRIRWQVQANPFTGPRTAGGYLGVTRDAEGAPYLDLERAGLYAVDTNHGSILRHVWSAP